MVIPAWFRGLLRHASSGDVRTLRNGRRRRTTRLAFESLEERQVLSADFAADRLLVQFKANVAETAKSDLLTSIAAQMQTRLQNAAMKAVGNAGLDVVRLAAGTNVLDVAARLKSNPLVAYAEPDWVLTNQATSNDPYYTGGSLWGMYGDASSPANQYGSQAAEAWSAGAVGSSSVYVGIIDEGIDYTHVDLAANIWTNPWDPADGVDNDGNGYVDDVHGWDFFNRDNTVYDAADGDRHGTHVAGTIGAVGGNGLGVAGVAWNVGLISLKFLGPGGGYTSDAVKALDYLTDLKTRHGMNIVASNNSWGGGGYSQALADAIGRAARANILFVAAAGNGGSDGVGDNNDVTANYPSNYNTTSAAGYDSVIAVAALNSSGGLASFSNYGATTVDLAAPGVGIYSTLPGNTYGSYSGTSMATPHVTGAVALYASTHAGATAAQIKTAVLDAARNTPTASVSGKTATGGRLNAGGFASSEPPPPTLTIGDASITEGNSGTKTLTFTVTLSAAAAQTVTVDYATANGSASAGGDYTAAAGTLSFAPGETTGTISVDVTGDAVVEPNETFYVNLSGAVNATLGDAQAVGTIVNDDVAPPRVSISNVSALERDSGYSNFSFTLTLSASSGSAVSVSYATFDGTALAGGDYAATSGSVTFAPGKTRATVAVRVYGDRVYEANETFYVVLSNPLNAVLGTATGVGTIRNDDKLTSAAAWYAANLFLSTFGYQDVYYDFLAAFGLWGGAAKKSR